jgi:hypothetical protein
MTVTVENLHTNLIDNVYGPDYLNMSAGGALLSYKNNSATYSQMIIDQTSALFYMKAVE